MLKSMIATGLVTVALSLAAATGEVIRTAAELSAATFDRAEIGRAFEVSGTLTTAREPGMDASFSFEDASGAMTLRFAESPWSKPAVEAGAKIHATGRITLGTRSRRAFACCEELEVLGTGELPQPVTVTAAEFLSGDFDCRLVRFRGVIRDIVRDEIDPGYTYVIVAAEGESIAMPVSNRQLGRYGRLNIGATIEVTGICSPSNVGARRQLGRHLIAESGIRILHDPENDPFLAPLIGDPARPRPQDIAALGRHRVRGHVLATWHGDSALIRTEKDKIMRLEIGEGPLPGCGELIEAVGFPESDLYRINLSRVVWRRLPQAAATNDVPADITAESLLTDETGRPRFAPYVHGRAIRLRGIVRNLPGDGNEDGRFNIESGSFIVPVDVSSNPAALDGITVGCEIAAAGICVTEIDNWRPNAPFPTIRGFIIVVRTPGDITVLRRPSWWTPQRLLLALGGLIVVLIGSLVWNLLLRRLAERRGRELAQSAIAKAESDLKVYERTRLAVELHDSISQYLTGISLAIRAAVRQSLEGPEAVRQNLTLAATSLDSCRQELRNCLWDLRNQTLDETDLNAAIRSTLEPHLGDAELVIRFNVPRERFSDNSAHAIMHILRELATNAVRHGRATRVKIAGSIEGDRLRFSVRDNGCGFDPATCPGMDRGHFGLQGIRERVNQFEGEMAVDSRPGAGSKVTISLHMPGTEETSR